jgi:hypothetical protein
MINDRPDSRFMITLETEGVNKKMAAGAVIFTPLLL